MPRRRTQMTERQKEVIALRRRGFTQFEIGEHLGVHHTSVRDVLRAAYRHLPPEEVTELKKRKASTRRTQVAAERSRPEPHQPTTDAFYARLQVARTKAQVNEIIDKIARAQRVSPQTICNRLRAAGVDVRTELKNRRVELAFEVVDFLEGGE